MTELAFVDTNIFVYSRDSRDTKKSEICSSILEKLWREARGRTSCQVLNELYVTLTQKLSPGMDPQQAWADVHDLMSWRPAATNGDLMMLAKHVQQKARVSWWDALIIGAASQQKCEILISEDLQHERVLFGLRIVNPFKPAAQKYL